MKRLNIAILTLLGASANLAGASPFVYPSPIPSPGPGDTASEINAQVSITQREIENVVTRIANTTMPGSFAAKDYWEVTPAYRKKLQDALVRFEKTMKEEILAARAAPAMSNYNTIATSVSLAPAQRALILKQQAAFLAGLFRDLSERYRQAAERAYGDTGMPLYRGDRKILDVTDKKEKKRIGLSKFDQDGRYGVTEIRRVGDPVLLSTLLYADYTIDRGSTTNYGDGRTEYKPSDAEKRFFERKTSEAELAAALKPFVAALRKECRSQICFSMRASDTMTALTLLQTLFSRRIEMKLADGTAVAIEPPEFPLDLSISVLSAADRFDIGDLPFDAQ